MSSPIAGSLRTIVVQPGVPTLLGTINDGSLIVNQSTTAAVWIAGQSSVSPGTGLRVGALGNLTWQANDANLKVWACVDTGVAVSITLTITDQAINPESPLDVAAALATQGIPSTLLTTLVGTFNIAPGATVTIHNLQPYASIALYGQGQGTFVTACTYQWSVVDIPLSPPPPGGGLFAGILVPDNAGVMQYMLPVWSSALTITNPNNGVIPLTVIGYNRQLSPGLIGTNFPIGGGRWELSSSTIAVTYNQMPLVQGLAHQGLCWLSMSVLYGNAASTPPQRWVVLAVPSGTPPSGNTASRVIINSGQVQQQSAAENTSRWWRYGWLGVLPTFPFDIYLSVSDALPSGVATFSLTSIPVGIP